MKHTFLILFLLFSSLYADKADFSVIIDKPFDAALFDVTQDYDRSITAVGFSKNYKNNSNVSHTYTNAFDYLANTSSNYGTQMHLIKVDNKANVLLSKNSHLPKLNEAIAVVKTPANGYFIGAYTLDGSLIVLKLDANGNPIFTKTFGTENYDRMNNLVLMSDGGVLAVGSSITSRASSEDMFNSGLGNNDIFLTRFSKDGNLLWSKKYGTMYDDRGIDAVEARDGSIIIVSITSYKKNRSVSFMRITENGDRIWLKHYEEKGGDINTIVPKKIIRLKDNNFVVSLSQYNNMQKEHIRLVKFDLYQNILIDKEIFTTYPSTINDIKEFSDGTFIAVGYTKDTYNTDALAMVLDSNLALLNQEHYGEENYDLFNGATILHNSQVAVVGVHTADKSQETNMWITKLNKDASMVQLATDTSTFYENLCAVFDEELSKRELVIQKNLTIEFSKENLLFRQGEYKLTKEQKIFLNKFSKKLITFLQMNKDIISTLEINGHTSSEWSLANSTERYLNNADLSLKRAFSTLSFIFQKQTLPTQDWLSVILKGSGYSYSKPVSFNSIPIKKDSRRVSFKIILKKKN